MREFDPDTTSPQLELELDRSPRSVVPVARFVSHREADLALAPVVGCPYCATPVTPWEQECACCGYRAGWNPPPSSPHVDLVASTSSTSSRGRFDVVLEPFRFLPFDFWKRVPVYAVLAMILGNGCTCGGLSSHTNASLVAMIAIGLIGAAASYQRNE